MNICVLSGKGGTGKTTVATNLAKMLDAKYIDADVEAPNGHLFFGEGEFTEEAVFTKKPRINKDVCSSCNRCVNACEFNALASVLDTIMVFDELCHGCGACSIVCHEHAIDEVDVKIGVVEHRGDLIASGRLDIGQPMAGPVIDAVISTAGEENMAIIDASPGSSCNVVKALSHSDYAVLVTEPTTFGLHDVKLAMDVAMSMNIPMGVILNRSSGVYAPLEDVLTERGIPLLGMIPFERDIASLIASGKLLVDSDHYKELFFSIINNMEVTS